MTWRYRASDWGLFLNWGEVAAVTKSTRGSPDGVLWISSTTGFWGRKASLETNIRDWVVCKWRLVQVRSTRFWCGRLDYWPRQAAGELVHLVVGGVGGFSAITEHVAGFLEYVSYMLIGWVEHTSEVGCFGEDVKSNCGGRLWRGCKCYTCREFEVGMR